MAELSSLEQAIMDKLLAGDHPSLQTLRTQPFRMVFNDETCLLCLAWGFSFLQLCSLLERWPVGFSLVLTTPQKQRLEEY